MKKEEVFSLFKIEDLNELPNAVMRIIEGDIRERNIIYHELMRMNGYDMSYDWFQELYENELSERKQKNNAYYHIQAINLPFQNIEFYYICKEDEDEK